MKQRGLAPIAPLATTGVTMVGSDYIFRLASVSLRFGVGIIHSWALLHHSPYRLAPLEGNVCHLSTERSIVPSKEGPTIRALVSVRVQGQTEIDRRVMKENQQQTADAL
jgi:hypothetical protein